MTGPAEKGEPVSHLRRRLVNLTIFLVVLGVLLAGTEVTLRALQVPFKVTFTPSENALARFDPKLGWSYVPDSSHVQSFGRARRPVPIHFDSIGARVARPDLSRDDRPTLIFVGGSYTMGHGVTHEETFAGRLEAALPVQVVNLGVQAYGTDQSLLRLEDQIDRFNVAAVIYTFIESHVLRNANDDRRLLIPGGTFLGTKPVFGLRADGSLYLQKQAARYEDTFQSSLVNWIRLWWLQKGPPPRPELTLALLLRMQAVTESHGGRFIVMLWRQRQVPVGTPYRNPLRSLSLSFVDTGVDAPRDWAGWVIPGDGHPDPRAHARAAELLRTKLAELGVIAPGLSQLPPVD